MLGQFRLQRSLQDRFGELFQKAVLADDVFRLLVIGQQLINEFLVDSHRFLILLFRWSFTQLLLQLHLLSLSEPQFSIACVDRPPHSLPRSFTRLIFSPLPLRRQSPFGVGLMSLLGSPVRSESDLALLIASTLSTPTACFRCAYRLCSGRNRTL